MNRAFIRIGDSTSHGGRVISGDLTFLIDNQAVARVGDLTVCPRCKGTFAITTGAQDMTSFGQATACDGDRTACGAVLIASQVRSTHSYQPTAGEDVVGSAAELASHAAPVTSAGDSGICLSCLTKAAKSGATMIVRG